MLRLSLTLALLGLGLGLAGLSLVGASIYLRIKERVPAGAAAASVQDCTSGDSCDSSAYVIQRLPPLEETQAEEAEPGLPSTPAPTVTPPGEKLARSKATPTVEAPANETPGSTPTPEFLPLGDMAEETPTEQASQEDGAVSEPTSIIAPLALSGTDNLAGEVAQKVSRDEEVEAALEEPNSEPASPEAEVQSPKPEKATLPLEPPVASEVIAAASACPASLATSFELIPIEGRPTRDHPGAVHGDLNLVLRGYIPTSDRLALVDYIGATDPDAPQLSGLFEPNRVPQISSVYRVNDWIWDSSQCGGHPRGCPGPPAETFWPVTLAGLATVPNEPVYAPERSAQIYSGGYVAMVLYVEHQRITLGYTRRDHAAAGYVIHIEDVCVNPNLVALYRAQLDEAGWNDTGRLPALRNNQPFGIALGSEIKVAIRDAGSFMDPRSRKDWWR